MTEITTGVTTSGVAEGRRPAIGGGLVAQAAVGRERRKV